jgi:formate hydrogenlyase subunit 3/multisubunit Na+/H+ antiporter MnhD subunit
MPSDILIHSIFIPLIAGATLLFLTDRLKPVSKAFALFITLLSFASSVYIFAVKPVSWPSASNAIFLADNLSGFIAIGVSLFAFLVTIYSLGSIEKSVSRYFGCVLIALGGSIGAVFSNHFVTLIVFWGLLALVLYLLVNMGSDEAAPAAANKALVIIGSTDALMLFGIAVAWAISGTFSMDKIRISLNNPLSVAAYISIAAACFAKAGAMPLHSWLPDVAEAAPTPVTAYLPASLDKLLGIYLLLRASLGIFTMNNISNLILSAAGSATIVLAVAFALVQHDLKRLLGFHAVSQVGYMVLGIGTGNPVGIAGGLFHMLNNAVYKTCLFFSGGAVEKKCGTTDLSKLGGLAKHMPLTFASFLTAALSISGIPPFNGFASKWMIYQGIIESASDRSPFWIAWLSCAMFGSALTVASFMKLLHAIFLGAPSKDFSGIKEAPLSMTLPAAGLAVICVIFGVGAFSIPLAFLILPAIGYKVSYIGIWSPAAATGLILTGLLLGLVIYRFLKTGKTRYVESFVGGESSDKLERVSGAEFYDTIRDIGVMGAIYRKEEAGTFDIYNLSGRIINFFTSMLRHLHNGILPTYMVWCLLGMAGIFLALFLK